MHVEGYVADACERAGPVEVARGHPCGIKLVQVPTAPADDGGPFSNEVLAVIDQEADLAFDAVETGDGQIWFSQGGACDRKRVVGVQGRSIGGRSVTFVAEVLGRSKSVFTEIGPVQIDIPRDREGSFEPQIVKKRQRFLYGVDEVVLSLTAVACQPERSRRASMRSTAPPSPRTSSAGSPRRSRQEMAEGANRPLDRVYPVVFIDAIHVKVRDGQVRNKPFYVVLGVTVNAESDILGIWARDGAVRARNTGSVY